MTEHTPTLKPCPFCGGEAIVKHNRTVMVSCGTCTASTFQILRDADSAITAWNTRTAEAGVVQELVSVVEMLAGFDARNSIVHLRQIARDALSKWEASK